MFANVRSVRSKISCFRKWWWILGYCLYHCTTIYKSTILNLNEDRKRMRWRARTSTKVECAWKSLLKTTEVRNTAIRQGFPSTEFRIEQRVHRHHSRIICRVLQEHKDRTNKKTIFPTTRTIPWRSPLCRGMYSDEDKTTFDDLW